MPDRSSADHGIVTILLVCTGNVCRSPMAERLARAFLDEALPDDVAAGFRVVSAGTRAAVGATMDPSSELVLQGLGGSSAKFWAQQLDADLATRADLTLTMTREHRTDVLALAPRSLARTFTLREAAALLASVGEVEITGSTVPDRLTMLVRTLAAARAGRRAGDVDDVPDPVGRPLSFHQEVGEAIADALLPLLERIAVLARESGDPVPAASGAPVAARGRH